METLRSIGTAAYNVATLKTDSVEGKPGATNRVAPLTFFGKRVEDVTNESRDAAGSLITFAIRKAYNSTIGYAGKKFASLLNSSVSGGESPSKAAPSVEQVDSKYLSTTSPASSSATPVSTADNEGPMPDLNNPQFIPRLHQLHDEYNIAKEATKGSKSNAQTEKKYEIAKFKFRDALVRANEEEQQQLFQMLEDNKSNSTGDNKKAAENILNSAKEFISYNYMPSMMCLRRSLSNSPASGAESSSQRMPDLTNSDFIPRLLDLFNKYNEAHENISSSPDQATAKAIFRSAFIEFKTAVAVSIDPKDPNKLYSMLNQQVDQSNEPDKKTYQSLRDMVGNFVREASNEKALLDNRAAR